MLLMVCVGGKIFLIISLAFFSFSFLSKRPCSQLSATTRAEFPNVE